MKATNKSPIRKVLYKDLSFETGLAHYAVECRTTEHKRKILLINRKENCHHTLLFNDYKQEIDYHKNMHGSHTPYTSLFKLPYAKIPRLVIGIKQVILKYLATTEIPISELCKRDFHLVALDDTQDDMLFISQRKNRFRFQKKFLLSIITDRVVAPVDVQTMNCQQYLAFTNYRKRLSISGLIIKASAATVLYVPYANIQKSFQEINLLVTNAATLKNF